MFAAEARDVAPETVNTDGWATTRNAFRALFPSIAVILRFLHGFLKMIRGRKARDLRGRVWEVYHAATAEEFQRLMDVLRRWCAARTWTAPVNAMLEKPWGKTESYVVAYDHPGCHRTSNAVRSGVPRGIERWGDFPALSRTPASARRSSRPQADG